MKNSQNIQEEILLRQATKSDRDGAIKVESQSTPNLNYVPHVFDMFVSDKSGEFSVAELNGTLVACGKFTAMVDGSAWVETLRVIPTYQGLGIGKLLYERFFEQAQARSIKTMRMYTGVKNAKSKGLAERFGFHLAATYRGAWLPCQHGAIDVPSIPFEQVLDPKKAVDLIMPLSEKWTGFLIMNRTFYAITPELCRDFAQKGFVYAESTTGSVMIIGARFMPEQALHIGIINGDVGTCLAFALKKGVARRAGKLSCLFPPSAQDIQQSLLHYGFQLEASDFIVMEVERE